MDVKYCEKCHMNVKGTNITCPLCQNKLSGEPEAVSVFPELPTVFRQFRIFFRLLILATISAGVICVAINLIIPRSGRWSLFVLLGITCFWVSLIVALRKRHNLFKNITDQVVILSLLCVLWDVITGWRGWSIDFFVPIACCVAMLSCASLAKVKKIPADEYIVYLISSVIFGLIPLVFYFTGLLTIIIPSVICMALSIITLAALIVFEGKKMYQEITRRFHF